MAPTTPSAAIERGRALFNRRRYFDAHDVWEEAWLRETGEPRRLLQGLIQLAAALHKASETGTASGCARLADSALARLEEIDGDRTPVDLTALRAHAEKFRSAAWN